MEDLLQLDACRPLGPTHLPPSMEVVDTPLDWWEWDRSLMKHPDQYIVNGIHYGFQVGFDYNCTCHKSHHNMFQH